MDDRLVQRRAGRGLILFAVFFGGPVSLHAGARQSGESLIELSVPPPFHHASSARALQGVIRLAKAGTGSRRYWPNFERLRQPRPTTYLVDSGDVLAIFIEGIQESFSREVGEDLPHQLGYPVEVEQDGTVVLPLVQPIVARGLSVSAVSTAVVNAYARVNIWGRRVIVTMRQLRMIEVVVEREDVPRPERRYSLELPGYDNDIFTALVRTGGIPEADFEIRITRSSRTDIVLPELLTAESVSSLIILHQGDVVSVTRARPRGLRPVPETRRAGR